MPISHDQFLTVEDCRAEAELIPGAALKVLNSIDGHLALFGVDAQFLAQVDGQLMALLATAA
jgi:homoserine O-acetyltransferase